MYTVGRLARRFGLSRSALLYYDRIGLLRPSCHVSGEYRKYSEEDAKRLEQIMTFRQAGLSLADIAKVLDTTQGRVAVALETRLEELSGEIRTLRDQQRLILKLLGSGKLPEDGALDKNAWVELLRASGFTEHDMRAWHREFEARSPEKHQRFLQMLCIPKDEIDMIRAYSAAPQRIKNILESSENYMKYLYELFEGLDRLGPGSPSCTARAFKVVPHLPKNARILDIGCGTGAQTMDLAALGTMHITAIDTHEPYLEMVRQRAQANGCADRVTPIKGDMRRLNDDLNIQPGDFDLLWSEGALYIMGTANALHTMRGHLLPGQCLCMSECVWSGEYAETQPAGELRDFWEEGYPEMMNSVQCLDLARSKGWKVLDHFLIGVQCWRDFYYPAEKRCKQFLEHYQDTPDARLVAEVMLREVELFNKYPGTWDYLFMVLQKTEE